MTKSEIAERIFTILAIAALWPMILGWHSLIYKIILVVILVILSVLLVNKFRRINQVFRDDRSQNRKGS